MCNEHGGIIDDLIVYQRASDNYRIVLNSATRQNDIAWIRKKSEGFASWPARTPGIGHACSARS